MTVPCDTTICKNAYNCAFTTELLIKKESVYINSQLNDQDKKRLPTQKRVVPYQRLLKLFYKQTMPLKLAFSDTDLTLNQQSIFLPFRPPNPCCYRSICVPTLLQNHGKNFIHLYSVLDSRYCVVGRTSERTDHVKLKVNIVSFPLYKTTVDNRGKT